MTIKALDDPDRGQNAMTHEEYVDSGRGIEAVRKANDVINLLKLSTTPIVFEE